MGINLKGAKLAQCFGLIVSSFTLIVLLLNSFDSSLKGETQRLLEADLVSSPDQRASCAALLGLFTSEKLNFQVEGDQLFQKLDSFDPARILSYSEDIKVPQPETGKSFDEKCDGLCKLSPQDRKRLSVEIKPQQYLLARYKTLMKLNGHQCNPPMALFKKPILGLFLMTRFQIAEYSIWVSEGRTQEAAAGLLEMNRYFQEALQSPKYTLVAGLIYLGSLKKIRKSLISLAELAPSLENSLRLSAAESWSHFKYEDLIPKIEMGELQAGKALMRYPYSWREEQVQEQGADVLKWPWSTFIYLDPLINKTRNYFFLKQATLNDHHTALQKAAWHPCLGQTDIVCESNQNLSLFSLRNPVGKAITQKITSNLIESFKKLKKRLNEIPHFEKVQ